MLKGRPDRYIIIGTGLIDAKHMANMEMAIYLYLYLQDRKDWDTGIVYGYTDDEAAQVLGKSRKTILEWRKRLIDGKYIECTRKSHGFDIEIKNTFDPRKKRSNAEVTSEVTSPEKIESDVTCDVTCDVTPDVTCDVTLPRVNLHALHITKEQITNNKEQSIEEGIPKTKYRKSSSAIFCEVTGMPGVPGSQVAQVNEAMDTLMRSHPDDDELTAYLKKYFDWWIKQRGKDGKFYSRTNCAWLYDHAVAGEPLPGERVSPTRPELEGYVGEMTETERWVSENIKKMANSKSVGGAK